MKCFQCRKEIIDKTKIKLLSSDGDFVCDDICEENFIKKRNEFFENIDNDEWYNNYMKINYEN